MDLSSLVCPHNVTRLMHNLMIRLCLDLHLLFVSELSNNKNIELSETNTTKAKPLCLQILATFLNET